MKKKGEKKSKVLFIVLFILLLLVLTLLIFMYFGGFNTGESANVEELTAYAGKVEDIAIPEDAQIIALGEATHGNVEFQKLKLDVFKLLVKDYGVRAFTLEGDFGGCEQVNRYIHGEDGTAHEAAAAIGFAIYRTEEIAELISFMRQYNDRAKAGNELNFYGFDMQRYVYSFNFLMEACREIGVNIKSLEKLMNDKIWNDDYDYSARMDIIARVKTELEAREDTVQAIHYADMLLQYCELQDSSKTDSPEPDYILLRDRFMAENIQWIAEQERKAGYDRIFVAGHNGHVARWGSYDSMGRLLAKEIGESYYVIGTDFYRTCCNVPRLSSGRRINRVFYSHDPLAKAAKTAKIDICWLDFSKVPKSSELGQLIADYIYMGNLGEGYAWYMRLLPPSYRIFQPPAELYDGMIFVGKANPTTIIRK